MPAEDPTIERRDLIRALDGRLTILHARGEVEAKRLRAVEQDALARLESRMTAPYPDGADERERERLIAERAVEIRKSLFAPITTGVGRAPTSATSSSESDEEPWLSVLVLGDLGLRDIQSLGCIPRVRVGDVLSASVPWSRLSGLAAAPGVRCVELDRALRPSLGTAIPATGIETLHGHGHKGNSVIVGVADYVLDFHHPALRDAAGSRVIYLWDQTLKAGDRGGDQPPPSNATGPGGSYSLTGLDYGVEYSRAKLTAQVASFEADPTSDAYATVRHMPPADAGATNAHGTYVTGIACGNGAGYTPPLPGAAPKSEIIFVHLVSESPHLPLAKSSDVIHAFSYIFRRAAALDQACVVNLSQNDAQGAHDGTSLLEQAITAEIQGPGRAVTISAGNDNDDDWHATGTLSSDVDFEREIKLLISNVAAIPEEAQVWFSGSEDFEFALDFKAPGPAARTTLIPWTHPGVTVASTVTSIDTEATAAIVLADPRNGDSMVELLLTPKSGVNLAEGSYFLRLRSTLRLEFHAWLSASNDGTKWDTLVEHDRLTIGLPATAKRVFGVAEHTNDVTGRTLTKRSGHGPKRDDARQPWIAAPGPMLVPRPLNRRKFKKPTLFYNSFSGTSAAAPLVAGTCALMFECLGKGADWKMLARALEDSAVQPGTVPWDRGWGFGYLQAQTLCPRPNFAEAQRPRPEDFEFEFFPVRVPRIITQFGRSLSDSSELFVEIPLVGSDGTDTVEIRAKRGLSLSVELPFLCLPWRRIEEHRALHASRRTRPQYRTAASRDPFAAVDVELDAAEANDRLDVVGVKRAIVRGGRVTLFGTGEGPIVLETLRIARSAKPLLRVSVRGVARDARGTIASVSRFSDGAWKGCVLLKQEAVA